MEDRANRSVWGHTQNGQSRMVLERLGQPMRPPSGDWDTFFDDYQMEARSQVGFTRLENAKCLTRYTSGLGNRSDLLLVTSEDGLSKQALPDTTTLMVFELSGGIPNTYWYKWQCGKFNTFDCRHPELWRLNRTIIKDWNVYGYKIDYCLAKEHYLTGLCSVQYFPELWSGEKLLSMHDRTCF